MNTNISSRADVSTWVANVNPMGLIQSSADVDVVVDAIVGANHPQWGSDWSEWLESDDANELFESLVAELNDRASRI